MQVNYWRLFLVALAIMAVVIVYRWGADAGGAVAGILPSARNSSRYNIAAGLMCVIGLWGVVRLIRNGRNQG